MVERVSGATMAVCLHTHESLSKIADDLKLIVRDLDDLRKAMKDAGVKDLPFDGEKGQVVGRTALHGFIASGQQKLRKISDQTYLDSLGEGR